MAAVMRCAMPTRDRAGARTRAGIRARRDGGAAMRAARVAGGARGETARLGGAHGAIGAIGGVGGTAARGTGRGARGRAASDAASAGSSYWSEETSRETETVVETTTGGVKATMTFAATEEEEEDEGAGAGKRALGLAAFAAVVAAFAYSDVSASFPFLAPAQTLARALVDMVAAGVDYFVDVTLDAYDAAILGCINVFSWFQSFLLTPGGVIENGAKASSAVMADPSTFVSKAVGLLCAKPFMSIAAVLLTLSRVVASWTFAAAEYACALLYAMPVYVFTPTAVLAYLYFKKRSIEKVEIEKVKSTRKMAKAKAKAATIVSTGSATGASAKWAERLAAGTTSLESFTASATRSSDVTVIDSSSDFSYSSSSSYANDASSTPIVATPVNYDSYSSSSSSASASASLSGFTGVYDFEESYANREALMGGYNIDQAEVERLYAELMPKDAGIPLPTLTVTEKVDDTAETKFMEQASSVATATKEEVKSTSSAAAAKAVDTKTEAVVKAEVKPTPVTPVKTSSSSSTSTTTTSTTSTSTASASGTKEVKKGGSKEAFLGFVDKVSSIKPEDVTKVVTETAKVVTSKESLDLAAKLASEAANKVQSSIKTVDEDAESKSTTLPGGTRKVSSQDDDLSEGTMIKKKK